MSPGLLPCLIWNQSASFRPSIRSPFSLTRPAAGGWWRSTGRTASPWSRTAGCASPAAFPTPDSVLSWVLTFGDKAELLEPEELREQLGKLTETLSDRYRRD